MTYRLNSIRIVFSLLVFVPPAFQGCASDKPYSQAELSTLQKREFNFSYTATYDAAVATFADLNYTIRMSDKQEGFLSAFQGPSLVVINFDQLGPSNTAVRITTSENDQTRVNKPLIDSIYSGIGSHLTSAERRSGA